MSEGRGSPTLWRRVHRGWRGRVAHEGFSFAAASLAGLKSTSHTSDLPNPRPFLSELFPLGEGSRSRPFR